MCGSRFPTEKSTVQNHEIASTGEDHDFLLILVFKVLKAKVKDNINNA